MKCPYCNKEIEPNKQLVWMRINGVSQSIEKIDGLNKKVITKKSQNNTKTGPRIIYVKDRP